VHFARYTPRDAPHRPAPVHFTRYTPRDAPHRPAPVHFTRYTPRDAHPGRAPVHMARLTAADLLVDGAAQATGGLGNGSTETGIDGEGRRELVNGESRIHRHRDRMNQLTGARPHDDAANDDA
jgi:hypothetical protein